MENNNGRGIFYGVMGVATLVVAIIGATFAFFAASDSGGEGAVGANAAKIDGTLSLTGEKADLRTNLIPVTNAEMLKSYVQTGTSADAKDYKCNGVSAADGVSVYSLCSTYEFTLNNTATTAQTVYVSFAPVTNTFKNLYYCVYEGAANTSIATPKKECGAVPTESTEIFHDSLAANTGTKTYTVVLYINETTKNQTDDDSNRAFTGTISASTSGNGNNVTGVVTAGA